MNNLYTRNVLNAISDLIGLGFRSFDELSLSDKENLASLGLKALGNDIDIVLPHNALTHLSTILVCYDKDSEAQLLDTIKQVAIDEFTQSFNNIFDEQLENLKRDLAYQSGKRQVIDSINGEARWL